MSTSPEVTTWVSRDAIDLDPPTPDHVLPLRSEENDYEAAGGTLTRIAPRETAAGSSQRDARRPTNLGPVSRRRQRERLRLATANTATDAIAHNNTPR